MKKIAVIAALPEEADLLQKLATPNLVVIQSGIGKVSAALKTLEIIKGFSPDLIINSGVAGGLDSSLKLGDSVCASKVCYHDVWCGSPNSWGQIQGLPLYYETNQNACRFLPQSVLQGLIVSGDQFITTAEALAEIKNKFPQALAVDMESAAIAQTCHLYNTPFISLRLISDIPGSPCHQAQYDAFWENAAEMSFENLRLLIEKMCS